MEQVENFEEHMDFTYSSPAFNKDVIIETEDNDSISSAQKIRAFVEKLNESKE